jgi:SAM-dependent methyltransferase
MNRDSAPDLAADSLLQPYTLIRKFGWRVAHAAKGKPILDVACGSGRNAIAIAQFGCNVICIDTDLSRLQAELLRLRETPLRSASERLALQKIDLVKDPWPLEPSSVGGIVNVHFFLPALLPSFESSISEGGYLLLESPPGCGGNYLELPKARAVKHALQKSFDVELYRERKVGPVDYDAVTVQLLAKRRATR